MFYFSFENFAKNSKERLIALGFPPFTLEDFHDIVCLLTYILFRFSSFLIKFLIRLFIPIFSSWKLSV